MDTLGQTIRRRRQALGLTLTELAEAVGATKSYLSMIENDRVANPPSRHLLAAIEQTLGVTDGQLLGMADWTKTPMRVRDELQRLSKDARRGEALARWLRQAAAGRENASTGLDQLYHSGELARRVDEALRDHETSASESIPRDLVPQPVRYRVPLINRVTAGYPNDFTDLDYPARVADEYIHCPDLTDADAFAARVVGESMLPQYQEGDVVVFSPAADVANGCDCFVRLEPLHETTFKRIFFEGEGDDAAIRLQPLNPSFTPAIYPRRQVAGLYRAVWKLQRLA